MASTPRVAIPNYVTGTVSGAAGQAVVTGLSTNWLADDGTGSGGTIPNVYPNDIFVAGATRVQILSVDSATQITLDGPLAGTLAGSTYRILRYQLRPNQSAQAALTALAAAGSDSSPYTSVTIDSGAGRGKLRETAAGETELAVGPSGTADGALKAAIRADPTTGVATLLNHRTPVNDVDYQILATDRTVAIIALTASRTITLPFANTYPTGTTLRVVDETGQASPSKTIAIVRKGSADTIGIASPAVTSVSIAAANGYAAFVSNGANEWVLVSASSVAVTAAGISDATAPGRALLTAASAAAQRTLLNVDKFRAIADANATVAGSDVIVGLTTLTASRTLSLPAANTLNPGQEFVLGDLSGSCSPTVTITIAAAGSDKINGQSSLTVTTAYGHVRLKTDGASNFFSSRSGVQLDASNKIPLSYLPASIAGAMQYQGTWNASTNSPALVSGAGTQGYFYKVSVAGATALDGHSHWNVGDLLLFDGMVWDKIDGIESEVIGVAGLAGDISAAALKSALAIVATDITNSTAAGRALLTAADAAAQKTALAIAAADIGNSTATGRAVLTAADAPTARTALAAAASGANADITSLSGIAAPLGGFRNRIVNGNFAVNQRAFASGGTLGATYGHDRWKGGASGCTYSFAASGIDTTVTITANSLTQIMEDVTIEGGTYTLSWAGTSQARIYQGSASGSYASSPITVSGLAAATATTVEFGPGTVGKVQFEPGAAATPFERRRPDIELTLCQRYFQRWQQPPLRGGVAPSALANRLGMPLPVKMRATPTVTMNGNLPVTVPGAGDTTIASIGTNFSTASVLEINATMSATTGSSGQVVLVYQSGTSSLDLNADL